MKNSPILLPGNTRNDKNYQIGSDNTNKLIAQKVQSIEPIYSNNRSISQSNNNTMIVNEDTSIIGRIFVSNDASLNNNMYLLVVVHCLN